jgi:hypothetical protein
MIDSYNLRHVEIIQQETVKSEQVSLCPLKTENNNNNNNNNNNYSVQQLVATYTSYEEIPFYEIRLFNTELTPKSDVVPYSKQT